MLKLALLVYVCHLSAVAFGVNVRKTHTQKLHTKDDVYGRENYMKKAKVVKKEEKTYCTCWQSLIIEKSIHVLLVVTKAKKKYQGFSWLKQ